MEDRSTKKMNFAIFSHTHQPLFYDIMGVVIPYLDEKMIMRLRRVCRDMLKKVTNTVIPHTYAVYISSLGYESSKRILRCLKFENYEILTIHRDPLSVLLTETKGSHGVKKLMVYLPLANFDVYGFLALAEFVTKHQVKILHLDYLTSTQNYWSNFIFLEKIYKKGKGPSDLVLEGFKCDDVEFIKIFKMQKLKFFHTVIRCPEDQFLESKYDKLLEEVNCDHLRFELDLETPATVFGSQAREKIIGSLQKNPNVKELKLDCWAGGNLWCLSSSEFDVLSKNRVIQKLDVPILCNSARFLDRVSNSLSQNESLEQIEIRRLIGENKLISKQYVTSLINLMTRINDQKRRSKLFEIRFRILPENDDFTGEKKRIGKIFGSLENDSMDGRKIACEMFVDRIRECLRRCKFIVFDVEVVGDEESHPTFMLNHLMKKMFKK